jgi:hypothetical protein
MQLHVDMDVSPRDLGGRRQAVACRPVFRYAEISPPLDAFIVVVHET